MSFLGNSNFLQALGWAVLNSIWQMAFLWVVFQVILSLGVKKSAGKSRLAAILLTTGFAWFNISLFTHWIINPAAAKQSLFTVATFDASTTLAWNGWLQQVLPYASAAYLLLLTLPIIQFVRNYRFVQNIRNNGLSKCNVDLRIFVQKFSERIGIRKPVHIYISNLITSPVTIGFLKPVILMPMAAITSLSPKQVEAVILHELAHIRRYDYFINLAVNFIRTILYFNPFVRLFASTIDREREKSCDEIVIQFQYDPYGYASALLELEKNNSLPQVMAIAASGQKNDLLNRIEKILGIEKRKMPDLKRLGGLLAGFICIISINALFFLSSPMLNNHDISFNSSNPFYSLISDEVKNAGVPTQGKKGEALVASKKPFENTINQTLTINHIKNIIYRSNAENDVPVEQMNPAFTFTNVSSITPVMPQLSEQEEDQVKETLEATKKVLRDRQWKAVEKNVADVLTKLEKQKLKQQCEKDISEVDWHALEDKLRLSYDQLNWDAINNQLSNAINSITIDSLSKVCNDALTNLSNAEKWMKENKVNSLPDTDVQLKEVKAQQEKLRIQLSTINSIKHKKIVHL